MIDSTNNEESELKQADTVLEKGEDKHPLTVKLFKQLSFK